MADDNATDAQSLKETGDAATYAQSALNVFSEAAMGARNVLDILNSKAIEFKSTLDSTGSLTKEQTTEFGLLTTAVLGTRRAFDNLSGIDTSYLSTFSNQINELQKTILEDSSLGTMTEKALALGRALNLPVDKVTELLKNGAGAVFSYANNLAESADNGLRLQNAYIQLSAATGNLNAIYETAGPNLDNINLLLSQQQKIITDSSTATGLSAEVVSQYYAQLGSVPKALEATTSGIGGTTDKTGLLTSVIREATGTGRSFSDVISDMKGAFRDYNITGEEALKFTSRISEISNNYGIELADVRDALRSTGDQFRMFGNEAEGAAEIYNSYLSALQKTGLSGNAAVDVVRGMVNGIKELGIAQKGFLSAQTGGPGGLLGAFQIEKELRDGKIDKVFDKVRQSLGKQFGSIVTLEEASQSSAAAAQLTKQIQVLRQGALGSFAKDDQSAIRILEAFRARDEGKAVPKELSQTIVQDTAKLGLDIEQKSYSELSRIRSLLEGARGTTNIANLGLLQRSATAGVGEAIVDDETRSKLRDDLKQNMNKGTIESGESTFNYSNDLINRSVKDRSGQFAYQTIDSIGKLFDQLSPAIEAPIKEIKSLFESGDNKGAERTYQDYLNKLNQEKEAALTLSRGAREQQLGQIENDKRNLTLAYEALNKGAGDKTNLSINNVETNSANLIKPLTNQVISNADKRITAGSNLGDVAVSAASNNKNVVTSGPSYIPEKESVNNGNLGDITVHVEGYCISCGEKMKNNAQSYAVNVGQRIDK